MVELFFHVEKTYTIKVVNSKYFPVEIKRLCYCRGGKMLGRGGRTHFFNSCGRCQIEKWNFVNIDKFLYCSTL
jgi:hypothetical protein